jgi:hypothetical protein
VFTFAPLLFEWSRMSLGRRVVSAERSRCACSPLVGFTREESVSTDIARLRPYACGSSVANAGAMRFAVLILRTSANQSARVLACRF